DLISDHCRRLQIFVSAAHLSKLKNYITTHIQPDVDYLEDETYEFPVANADCRVGTYWTRWCANRVGITWRILLSLCRQGSRFVRLGKQSCLRESRTLSTLFRDCD
uniref:Helicase C-terminal domain-containing protein n=1 Tax=Parascaris univalens TaxID=6257 RepID=A0A915ASY0_PARUN